MPSSYLLLEGMGRGTAASHLEAGQHQVAPLRAPVDAVGGATGQRPRRLHALHRRLHVLQAVPSKGYKPASLKAVGACHRKVPSQTRRRGSMTRPMQSQLPRQYAI